MTVNWLELSSLMSSAMPMANVNLLCNEADKAAEGEGETAAACASPVALEVRPRSRLFESFGAPPAKWTVMVYGLPSSVFKVYVIKMDRQVLEQRQFPSSQTMELVEFVKGHAFINSLWSFCRGIRSKVSTTMPDRFWVDNFGECPIRRSPMCELLVSLKTEDSPASSLCKFCAAADINMSMDFMGAGGDFDPDLLDEEVKPEVVFKEEPESDGFEDFDPENGDSDYEPERKPRKRSAAAAATLRKPKTEENDEEDGGDDGCDSKSAAKSTSNDPKTRDRKCESCGKEFRTELPWIKHMNEMHKGEPGIHIPEMRPPVRSGRPVRRYNEDDKESTAEGSSMIFTCKVCGQEYKKELSWIKHMHQSHKDEPGLQLPEIRPPTKRGKKKSPYVHKRRDFFCNVCGKTMEYTSRYYHMKAIHSIDIRQVPDTNDHKCEFCGKTFFSEVLMGYHKKKMHTHSDDRPFVCQHCGKSYKCRESVAECQRRCTGQGHFECSTCGRTFTRNERLKHHIMGVHQGIKPHKCPVCPCSYARKSNMIDHIKRVHKMKLSDILATMKKEHHHQLQHEEGGTEDVAAAPAPPPAVLEIPQISQ